MSDQPEPRIKTWRFVDLEGNGFPFEADGKSSAFVIQGARCNDCGSTPLMVDVGIMAKRPDTTIGEAHAAHGPGYCCNCMERCGTLGRNDEQTKH